MQQKLPPHRKLTSSERKLFPKYYTNNKLSNLVVWEATNIVSKLQKAQANNLPPILQQVYLVRLAILVGFWC